MKVLCTTRAICLLSSRSSLSLSLVEYPGSVTRSFIIVLLIYFVVMQILCVVHGGGIPGSDLSPASTSKYLNDEILQSTTPASQPYGRP